MTPDSVSGAFWPRVGVALVGIPLVLWIVALGGWVLGVLVAVAAAVASLEFTRLARGVGYRPFGLLGVMGSIGLIALATARPGLEAFAPWGLGVLMFVALGGLALGTGSRGPGGGTLGAVSVTVLGTVYVGLPLAFILILRGAMVPDADPRASIIGAPAALVILPLMIIWAGDSAAYLVGRGFGRRKLAPRLSPGKTWEGALAGLAASAAVSVAVVTLVPLGLATVLTVGEAVGLGTVVGAVGQWGDLVESLLKREAGVKDSGGWLPGHGGMLDRLDALLFAFPVTWIVLVWWGALS